jgi:hypothetical protein
VNNELGAPPASGYECYLSDGAQGLGLGAGVANLRAQELALPPGLYLRAGLDGQANLHRVVEQ